MGDARFNAGTIEEYRERPIEFAYRTGLNHGIADGLRSKPWTTH